MQLLVSGPDEQPDTVNRTISTLRPENYNLNRSANHIKDQLSVRGANLQSQPREDIKVTDDIARLLVRCRLSKIYGL